ncbi:MAG: acyl-CoA dehydratase activase [Bacillota bacterium]
MKKLYIGVDIGSVSINIVGLDENKDMQFKLYKRNPGQPVEVVKEGLKLLNKQLKDEYKIAGVGVTGSGRQLIGYILGADIVKNEITAHATATIEQVPDVGTIFEIGGQDSKLIIVNNGIVTDFAMNTVCAAGTGSFLDHQAERLGVKIEEFGDLALESQKDVRIAGRCTVFAESDMISKQQYGFTKPEIIDGLCKALVRNYMNNLVRGKDLKPCYVFQGGVAANVGIKAAIEEEINSEVIVPENHDVMGAIGIAVLAKNKMEQSDNKTGFKGFSITHDNFETTSFICGDCANECEVIRIQSNGKTIAMTGDRCGKWSNDPSLIDDQNENLA